MGLATIDLQSHKVQTKLYKIPKFGVNKPNGKQGTVIWNKGVSFEHSVRLAIHFFVNFAIFKWLLSQSKLAWLTPNFRIVWISVCFFWICGSVVAYPIVYRFVTSPSRYEIRQWSIDTCPNKVSADQYHMTISWTQVKSSSRSHVIGSWPLINDWFLMGSQVLTAAKYKIQKPSTCHTTLFCCMFWSMFLIFHLACSTWPATKTFVVGWTNAVCWLVDLLEHESICCETSCAFDEKQATNQNLLLKVYPRSTFCNNFQSRQQNSCFCRTTSWSRKVKNWKHWPKLAMKQCCATSWRVFSCILPP